MYILIALVEEEEEEEEELGARRTSITAEKLGETDIPVTQFAVAKLGRASDSGA